MYWLIVSEWFEIKERDVNHNSIVYFDTVKKKRINRFIIIEGTKDNALNIFSELYPNIKIMSVDEVYCCDASSILHSTFSNKSHKPKILILGSHMTMGSIEAGYYYLNVENNPFWKMAASVFDEPSFYDEDNKCPANKNIIVSGQKRNNIVVHDFITKCFCLSTADCDIIKGTEFIDEDTILSLIKEADLLLLNGGHNSHSWLAPLDCLHKLLKGNAIINGVKNKNTIGESGTIVFDDGSTTVYKACPSTSGSNTSKLETKIIEWKKRLK